MYLSKVLKSGLVIGELEPTIKHVHLQGSAVVAKTSKFGSEDFHSQTAVNWALAENTKTVKYHVKYTSKSNTNKDTAPFLLLYSQIVIVWSLGSGYIFQVRVCKASEMDVFFSL